MLAGAGIITVLLFSIVVVLPPKAPFAYANHIPPAIRNMIKIVTSSAAGPPESLSMIVVIILFC